MTPQEFINDVFMLLFKRPATPEEISEAMQLMNRIITEMEKDGA